MNNWVFLNGEKDLVKEYLIGFAAYNQSTALFDYGNVLVRKNFKECEKVRIVAGGCSGNEPTYAGFVGNGMLTAAIQGNIFLSPTSKDVLRTIRELSLKHTKGVLCIVRGSSGNLLNFGLAAERAANEGLRVRLLGVADDCNNANFAKCKKRGSSGIILVMKVAGFMSESNFTLDEIFAFCSEMEKHLFTVSLGFKSSSQTEDVCICKKQIEPNEMVIGIGLNEEPGIKKIKLSSPKDVSRTILEEFMNVNDSLHLELETPLVILVNNINGLSKAEEFIFVKNLVEELSLKELKISRLYVGSFITSPILSGLTVTIMKVYDAKVLEYLDAPCNVPAWINVNQFNNITLENIIPGKLKKQIGKYVPFVKGSKLGNQQSNILKVSLRFMCDALISCERQLNIIDSEHGDGDCGTRLKNACEFISRKMSDRKLPIDCPATLFDYFSKLLESNIGGTLGCIYSILFQAAANFFSNMPEQEEICHRSWLEALIEANKALKKYGNVDFGDMTMYDSLEMCALTVKESLDRGENFLQAFGLGVSAAEEAAQKTRLPQCRYPDSGAHAVGIWMRAAYEGVKLSCPEPE